MSWPTKVIRTCLILSATLVPLIWLPFTSELFEFNKIILVYLFSATIAFSWISDWILTGKFRFRHTFLDWSLLIFLFIQFVSLLFSIDPRISWLGYYSRFNGGLASWLCYSLIYWATVTFSDTKSIQLLLKLSIYTALAIALYGILEHFGIDANWWVQDVKNRVFSTLGQPNWLAAYLIALIFFPLSTQVSSRSFFSFSSLAFLILFITLLFTKSRSGLLAFSISASIFWILIFFQNFKSNHSFKIENLKFKIIIFAILTLTLTLTISNPIRDLLFKSSAPAVTPTGTALEVGGTESGEIRKIVWQGAVDIWRSSSKTFLIGTGPETFAMAYYQHRPIAHNNTSEWELLYNKAHNEFLNFLATTGLLGLLSYLGLLVAMFILLLPARNSKIVNYYLQITALLAGWLTLPVTNFWGFSVVPVQVWLFLLPALAVIFKSPSLPPTTSSNHYSPLKNFAILTVFTLYGFLLFSIIRYWVADINYASGQKQLKAFTLTQDPEYILASYTKLQAAYELNHRDAPLVSDFSVVTAYLSLLISESDATASAQLQASAEALSDLSVALSPTHPNYWKSRSRMFIILSTLKPNFLTQADAALARAMQLSPTDPRLPYSRGVIAGYKNEATTATQFYNAALKLKPNFADPRLRLEEIASASANTP